MAAKVAKDLLNELCLKSRSEDRQTNSIKLYEDCIRSIVEGSSTSSEFWKDISIRFKKQYGTPLSNNELIGGFFLNSLIKLLRLTCDPAKLNKAKKIFKEEGIVGPGFIVSAEPKSKSYYRFTSDFIDKIKYACKEEKKDEDIYAEIVSTLQL